ncbi:MAG: GIY-YIG nuclease family protein, partial [Alphaproteobacteria bacterium]|nr:GIY-YIG nuclease family protein [Alphaproteobacteria bacterium]MBU1794337.1 GIY-YIG nuclease family protein [Alphaproteobacteria bacterium]
MTFHAYMLRCSDGSYYTGHTDSFETRIAQHQSGAIKGYTFDRRPVELVWCAEFGTRAEALASELQIKGWSRKKKEALIAENWDSVKKASVSRTSPSLSDALRLRSGRTEDKTDPSDQSEPVM